MNELSIDSIRAKQGGKALFLVRCLAGLLVINLLTLGIASWARMSRASVPTPEVAPEFAQDEQPSRPLPPAKAPVAVSTTTVAPSKVNIQPLTPVKIKPSEKTSQAPLPIANSPKSSPIPPIAAEGAATPAKVPPGDQLEKARASLNSLLAQGRGTFSGIPFAAAAPGSGVSPSKPSSPVPPIAGARELPRQPVKPAHAFLRLVNPPETGGEVHFEIDGKGLSLRPGEFQQIPPGGEHEIAFHRGDNFGDVKLTLRQGVYVFGVGSAGWELKRAEQDLEASVRRAP